MEKPSLASIYQAKKSGAEVEVLKQKFQSQIKHKLKENDEEIRENGR